MNKLLIFASACLLLFSCEKNQSSLSGLKLEQVILQDYFIKSIEFDNDGNAWIGTFKQGLIKYNSNEQIVFNSENSVIRDTAVIYDIAIDSKNNIWIGEEGLVKYDGQNFFRFNSENTDIPEDFVSNIEIDSKDNVWFASSRFKQGGMVKYDGSEFIVYTPENSDLPAHLIAGIAIADNDDIWIAMNEIVDSAYLVKISDENWSIYTSGDLGFNPYYLGRISTNSFNQLIGCVDYSLSSLYYHEGPHIYVFNGEGSLQFKSNARFSQAIVFVDKDDRIWSGSCDGLSYIDENNNMVNLNLFDQAGIYSINQAPDGKLWIGTSEGICIYTINE